MIFHKSRILGTLTLLTLILVGFQNCGKMKFQQDRNLVAKAELEPIPTNPSELEDPPIPGNDIPDPDGDDTDDSAMVCEDRMTDLSGKKALSVMINVKKITLALRPTRGMLFPDAPHLFRFFDLQNTIGSIDIFKLRTGMEIQLPPGFEPDPSRLNSAFFVLETTGNRVVWEDGTSTDLKISPAFSVLRRDPFLRIKIQRRDTPNLVADGLYKIQMDPICLNHVAKYKRLGWLRIFGITADEGLYLRFIAKKRAVLTKLP